MIPTPPAMSAISRSTSCEEMPEPTMAIAITSIVVIAPKTGEWVLHVRHL
jgi:hypothetical protein